jgi:hypothetical protein
MLSSACNSISRLQEKYRSRISFKICFKKGYLSVSDFPKIRDSGKKKEEPLTSRSRLCARKGLEARIARSNWGQKVS